MLVTQGHQLAAVRMEVDGVNIARAKPVIIEKLIRHDNGTGDGQDVDLSSYIEQWGYMGPLLMVKPAFIRCSREVRHTTISIA